MQRNLLGLDPNSILTWLKEVILKKCIYNYMIYYLVIPNLYDFNLKIVPMLLHVPSHTNNWNKYKLHISPLNSYYLVSSR